MSRLDSLLERRAEILAVAARYGARNVRVFGSVARGEAGPDSDVDLLAGVYKIWGTEGGKCRRWSGLATTGVYVLAELAQRGSGM